MVQKFSAFGENVSYITPAPYSQIIVNCCSTPYAIDTMMLDETTNKHDSYTTLPSLLSNYTELSVQWLGLIQCHADLCLKNADCHSKVTSFTLLTRKYFRLKCMVGSSPVVTGRYTFDRQQYRAQYGPDFLSYVGQPSVHSRLQTGHCCRDQQSYFSWRITGFKAGPHC